MQIDTTYPSGMHWQTGPAKDPLRDPVTAGAAGTQTDSIMISDEARRLQAAQAADKSNIDKLAAQYDVRDMSAPEMRQLAQKMYDSGTIGLSELGVLTMVPIEVARSGNRIECRPLQSDQLTFDFLKNITDARDFARVQGLEGVEFLEKTVTVLERLDATRRGPSNRAA